MTKDLVGYEGIYSITDTGSIARVSVGGDGTPAGYELRSFTRGRSKPNDYLVVNLCKNGVKRLQYVHRLVAQTFLDNPCNLPLVNHKDGDKQNNCADNLEWCTPLHNVRESMRLGLSWSKSQREHFGECIRRIRHQQPERYLNNVAAFYAMLARKKQNIEPLLKAGKY